MRLKLTLLLLAVPLAIASFFVWNWYKRSTIIRDGAYHQLLADFQKAETRNPTGLNAEQAGWNFKVEIPEKQSAVWVRAADQPGVVRIQYEGATTEEELYEHSDYSAPVEIKISGRMLYVHWVEPLFGLHHRILAYDLAAHHETIQRRIDPQDLSS